MVSDSTITGSDVQDGTLTTDDLAPASTTNLARPRPHPKAKASAHVPAAAAAKSCAARAARLNSTGGLSYP
jgi:hypothetical protein